MRSQNNCQTYTEVTWLLAAPCKRELFAHRKRCRVEMEQVRKPKNGTDLDHPIEGQKREVKGIDPDQKKGATKRKAIGIDLDRMKEAVKRRVIVR